MGKETYVSISAELRRWLGFVVELRHVTMFNEAVVHVVGQWPDLTLQKNCNFLMPRTFAPVERKVKELCTKILD